LAYHAKGDHAAANADLAMAVTVNPDDADTQYAYGQIQEAQDNELGAVSHYRTAYRLNPTLTGAGLSLGQILLGRGDYQEAQQVLSQVIDREPDAARAHLLLGMARDKQDQPDAAIGEFAKAAELDPGLAAAYYWHGKILLDKKQDVAGAFPLLKKAAEMEGENVDFLSDYGVALVNTQQFGEAVTVLSKAAASPDYSNPRALYSLGAAHLNTQNFVAAVQPFRRAIEALPNWGQPHIGLAWATFAQIPKGCPCGPEDEERVRNLTEHYRKAVELGIQDPALKERVDVLGRGEKIR
jgi:tetratricopeptide (TPR) repeat protein